MKKDFLIVLFLLCFSSRGFCAESLSSGEVISVSPATGQLKYELPLYTINNPDFKWDIGISYISDGFRPYDYSFPVGSGWQLVAGGYISREIIGVADDLDTIPWSTPLPYDIGYLAYIHNSNVPSLQNKDYKDVGSDIYSFTFGPYSGSFIFDSIGNAIIISGDFLFVDATNVTLQFNRADYFNVWDTAHFTIQPSCFKLTTLDGYKYYFGSTTSTAPLEYGGPFVEHYTPPINKWNLQRVEAPNGFSLVFHYHSPWQKQWEYDAQYNWKLLGNPVVDVEYISSDTLSMELHKSNPYYHPIKSADLLYRYSILDSITNPQTGLTVSFAYNWRSNYVFKYNPSPNGVVLGSTKPFLSSVQVKAGDQTLKSWSFNYTYKYIDSTPRQYLTSVADGCDNIYSYVYDFTGQIHLDTLRNNIDSYGYSLFYPEYGSLISSSNTLGTTHNYSYSWAIVDSIRIPEYTLGQWSTNTMAYPHMMCHAIKLSNINVTDGTSLLFSKSYDYGAETGEMQQNAPLAPGIGGINFHGSGVLSIEHGYYKNVGSKFVFTPFQNLHASKFPITYSYVKETLMDANANTTRTTTFHYPTDRFTYAGISNLYYSTFSKTKEALPYYQSLLWFRLLKSRTEKDASGQVVAQTSNDYSGPATNNNLIYYTNKKYWNNVPSSKYYCSHRIEMREQVSFMMSTSYDSKFRVTLQSQSQGNDTLFTRMVYPDNLTNNFPSGMPQIDSCYMANMLYKTLKIIGEPIEVYGGFIKNGTEHVTNGTLSLKKIFYPTNMSELAIVTSITLSLHPTSPLTSYSHVHTQNMSVRYNTNYDTVSVARYQRWNRLVWEKRANAALGTSYQWSANQLYPISKTIGNLTWQYTGSPYLGITSETSPSGLIINYQYDNCGRLEEKYILHNNQKEILEHYIYH